MNHLSKAQLHHLMNKLVKEYQSLEKRFISNDHFGLEEAQRYEIGELSLYDNHPADIATELYERSKDISLNEQAEMQMTEIKQALIRMKEGRYGTCDSCGKPILFERLDAIPTTAFCIMDSPSQERTSSRPIEEEFLQPPFGRTSLDEREDQNQFDGEDAWQIVESWGTSDSPALHESPGHDYDSLYIEADENEGYVEPIESFLATDLYGQQVTIVRNPEYHKYMARNEGDTTLMEGEEQD